MVTKTNLDLFEVVARDRVPSVVVVDPQFDDFVTVDSDGALALTHGRSSTWRERSQKPERATTGNPGSAPRA